MTGETKQRIDKWLFFSRSVKSRTLAGKLAETGIVRENGARTKGASHELRVGDRVEIELDRQTRALIVKAFGTRRGPASEAALMFEDQTPPAAPKDTGLIPTHGGRPEKAQRRAFDRLRAKIFDQ